VGALGKFEVVLGYVVEYVNSPFCQRIVGNYFVSSKSECDRESLDPAFERSKAVERLERLAFTGCLMTKRIPKKLELSNGVWSLNVEPLNFELL
jgi:hypothetical protein